MKSIYRHLPFCFNVSIIFITTSSCSLNTVNSGQSSAESVIDPSNDANCSSFADGMSIVTAKHG